MYTVYSTTLGTKVIHVYTDFSLGKVADILTQLGNSEISHGWNRFSSAGCVV